jgi:hypothetical protein
MILSTVNLCKTEDGMLESSFMVEYVSEADEYDKWKHEYKCEGQKERKSLVREVI